MDLLLLLRETARDLALPPASLLLLALCGLMLLRSRPRLGRSLLAAGLFGLWLLSTPVVADRLQAIAERYPALVLSQPTGAGAVVILSESARTDAPEYGSDAPDPLTLERMVYGAYVAHRTGLAVLVSGGSLYAPRPVAAAMANFLERDLNTPVRWIEGRAHDTHENALYSAKLLSAAGIHRIILVTGAMHMARAAAEFRAAGLDVVPAPVRLQTRERLTVLRVIPQIEALERSHAALYELLGRAVFAVRQLWH